MSALIYIYVSIVLLLIVVDVYLLFAKSRKRKKAVPETAGAADDSPDKAERLPEESEETAAESEEAPAPEDVPPPEPMPEEDIVHGEEQPMDFGELEAELSAFRSDAGEEDEYGDGREEEIIPPTEEESAAEAYAAETDIVNRLVSNDPMSRLSAAEEASHFINSPDVVTGLIRCLEDESPGVRAAAAAALEYSDDERVIEPLISYLQGIDSDILEQSQRFLDLKTTQMGKRLLRNAEEDEFKRWPLTAGDDDLDITPLTRVLQDRNIDFRGRAEDLDELEAREVGGELKSIAADSAESENVRSLAIYTLGRIQDTSASKDLCTILEEESPSLRYSSALALAELGDSSAVDALLEHLRDDNRFVRSAVAYALGHLGEGDVVIPLVESLNDPEEGVRHTLWKSLREIRNDDPDTVRQTLESALRGADAELRKYAAEAAGKLDDKVLAPLLREMLEADGEADAEARLAIAGALVELEDLEAVTQLIEASRRLDEEFKMVVKRMSEAPSKPAPRRADPMAYIQNSLEKRNIPPEHLASVDTTAGYYATASSQDLTSFSEAMKNNSMYVRGCAVYQLAEVDGPEVSELLLGALKDPSSYVRGAAAEVLGLKAEGRAAKQLVKLAWEATVKDVRLKAIKALGRLSEPTVEKELKKLSETKDLDVVRYARVALNSFSSR